MRSTLAAGLAVLAAATLTSAPARAVDVGQSGWSWGAPRPQGNDLYAAGFADAQRGYAVGAFGTILRTDDGGATWAGVPTGLTATLGTLAVLGPDAFVAGGGCVLRRSDDGGRTLVALRFVPRERSCSAGLSTLSFPSADVGLLGLTDGTVLRTDDGGRTFARRADVPGLLDLAFATATTGFAATSGGVARTLDGGRTWKPAATLGRAVRTVTIAPGGAVLAAGDGGLVLRSTDGGESFEPQTMDGVPNSTYVDVACGAPGRCLLATAAGRLVRTEDGGETATVVDDVDDADAVTWVDGGHAVAVGRRGATRVSGDGGATFSRAGAELGGRYRKLRAASSSLAAAAGRSGGFALSTDGGASWAEGAVSTTADLVDVSFPSATSGFALDDGGTLYRTDNGGESWRILDTGTTGRPQAVLARTATGVLVAGPHGVRRSTDGGEAFDAVGPAALRDAAIDQLDAAGAAVLAYGRRALFVSRDGGRSWRALRRPSRRLAIDTADFVSARTGFVLDDAGRAFATGDGGRHWRSLSAGGAPVVGLSFATARAGWLVLGGFPHASDAGWVLRTDDGGRSFRPQLVSPTTLEPAVTGTPTLAATGAKTAIALSLGRREADDDYSGGVVFTGPQSLFATGTAGDAGRRTTLTLHAPRHVRRGRRAQLSGRISPALGGETITLWQRVRGSSTWRALHVRTGSRGGFSLGVRLLRTSRFLAQWPGDAGRSGAGTPVVVVRVR